MSNDKQVQELLHSDHPSLREMGKIFADSEEADRRFRPWLIVISIVPAAVMLASYLGLI